MKINRLLYRSIAAILFIGVWTGLVGCSAAEEEVTPTDSDGVVSFKVNGKTYSGGATSLGDADYFYIWSVASINDNDGYSLQIELDEPKVGTFTPAKNNLRVSIASLKGTIANPKIQEYELPTNGSGSITLSQHDTKGFAEGTFSFTGVSDTGQRLQVTDGKFKIDLR